MSKVSDVLLHKIIEKRAKFVVRKSIHIIIYPTKMHFSVRLSVGPYSVFVSLVVIPKASASGHKNQRVVLAKFPNDHNSYDRVNRHGADEGTDILT